MLWLNTLGLATATVLVELLLPKDQGSVMWDSDFLKPASQNEFQNDSAATITHSSNYSAYHRTGAAVTLRSSPPAQALDRHGIPRPKGSRKGGYGSTGI